MDGSSPSRRRLLGYALAAGAAVPGALALGSTASARIGAPARGGGRAGPPQMNVLWSTDFANGWEGWQDTPWNDEPQGEVKRPTVVDSPLGKGKSARFHLDGGQKRTESQPDGAQKISEGDTLIVRFTDFLEDGFPVGTEEWQIVMQFKNDSTGSPPCEVKIGNGLYALDGNEGAWHYDIGEAVTGRPIEITLRISFSTDPGKSVMDAWYNGEQTVTAARPEGAGTLYEGQSSYLKTGIYRDTAIADAGTRCLDSLAIGTPA